MTLAPQRSSRLRAWRSLGVAFGLAAVGFLAGFALVAVGADQAGVSWSASQPYTLWDQAHYLSIAEDGYSLISCAEVPGYPPDEWCGNAGWYPGYPALIRAASDLGLPPVGAAVVMSNAALYAVLFLVAWLLGDRPIPDRLIGVLGASWFPGAIYYRAAFPIAVSLLGVLGAFAALRARRWLPAGLSGALAVVTYPQGILLGAALAPAVVGWARHRSEPGGRHDLGVAARFAGCLAAAFLAVLVVYETGAGRWDAWFLVHEKYDVGLHVPVAELIDRLGPLTSGGASGLRVPAIQTALLAVLMVVVFSAAWWRRRSLDRLSLMALAFCAITWLFPLSLGEGLSLYRAESLLLPAVLLFPLLPRWLAVATVATFGVLMVPMARLFFDGTLI